MLTDEEIETLALMSLLLDDTSVMNAIDAYKEFPTFWARHDAWEKVWHKRLHLVTTYVHTPN